MKIHKYSGDEERTILMGLVTNKEILARVLSGLKAEAKPFQSKWSNVIFQWCKKFFAKYKEAPDQHLAALFRRYAAQQPDDVEVSMIEKFLVSLDDEYRQLKLGLNTDFVVDMASQHFNHVRASRLRDQLDDLLLDKEFDKVQEELAKFQPVDFTSSALSDTYKDEEKWNASLETSEADVMLTYPGALGEFFGTQLSKGRFVSFLAPEKRGKSFWLIDVAWRAVRNRKRVLFVSAGDMGEKDVMQRITVRAARRPIPAGTIRKPVRMVMNTQNQPKVKIEDQYFPNRATKKEWRKAREEIQELTASKDSLLKLICFSNSSINFTGIAGVMDNLIQTGWIPDVVVLDYMDILSPEDGTRTQDFRHQVNETWKAGRRLSQDYHVLLVTATQSDAASYESKVLTRSNFSEDKRKLSHITAMCGINQMEAEKQSGLYRLNWVMLREGIYYESKCVHVAGCLAIANPAMKSVW